jgi:hypothetical protein
MLTVKLPRGVPQNSITFVLGNHNVRVNFGVVYQETVEYFVHLLVKFWPFSKTNQINITDFFIYFAGHYGGLYPIVPLLHITNNFVAKVSGNFFR